MIINKAIVCADGFTMSVQAHQGAYCDPRVDNADTYTTVEVGFPSTREEMLMEWAESPNRPTETVYAWVPTTVVRDVIAKHGGIASGDLPPGIPFLVAPQDR